MTSRHYFPRRGTKVLAIVLHLADKGPGAKLGLHEICLRFEVQPKYVYGLLKHAVDSQLLAIEPDSRPVVYTLGPRGAARVQRWRDGGCVDQVEPDERLEPQPKAPRRRRPEALATSVATPNRIDIMHCPAYVPAPWSTARPGADDHRRHASRGYR